MHPNGKDMKRRYIANIFRLKTKKIRYKNNEY